MVEPVRKTEASAGESGPKGPSQSTLKKMLGLGFETVAKSFLKENPNPTDHEVRLGISGNLCRCTGYQNIVKSLMAAAKEMKK